MNVVVDTNILIDLLRGREQARSVLRRHRRQAISVVTRIELLAGPADDMKKVRDLLEGLEVERIDDNVAEAAAAIRREHRLKLPDAVILATARVRGVPLLTRNTHDFDGLEGVEIPYRL